MFRLRKKKGLCGGSDLLGPGSFWLGKRRQGEQGQVEAQDRDHRHRPQIRGKLTGKGGYGGIADLAAARTAARSLPGRSHLCVFLYLHLHFVIFCHTLDSFDPTKKE